MCTINFHDRKTVVFCFVHATSDLTYMYTVYMHYCVLNTSKSRKPYTGNKDKVQITDRNPLSGKTQTDQTTIDILVCTMAITLLALNQGSLCICEFHKQWCSWIMQLGTNNDTYHYNIIYVSFFLAVLCLFIVCSQVCISKCSISIIEGHTDYFTPCACTLDNYVLTNSKYSTHTLAYGLHAIPGVHEEPDHYHVNVKIITELEFCK